MDSSRDGDGVNYGNMCSSRFHWRHDEDQLLLQLVRQHGAGNWNLIAANIKGRTGKSCRLRWVNQLSPKVNKSPFDRDEEEKLIRLHQIHGNRWSTIARFLPGRTDNQVKNQYNVIKTRNKRQLLRSQSTGIVHDRSNTMRCGSIFRPSMQKQWLVSSPSSSLSHLNSSMRGTASTPTPPLDGNFFTGIDINFVSIPLSASAGLNALRQPLNCYGSSSSLHGKCGGFPEAEFTGLSRVLNDYAGGFNHGEICDNERTSNSQRRSPYFIYAIPQPQNTINREVQMDESVKHNSDHFIDFLGVGKSD